MFSIQPFPLHFFNLYTVQAEMDPEHRFSDFQSLHYQIYPALAEVHLLQILFEGLKFQII